MTADDAARSRSEPEEEASRLVLRESRELQQIPSERPPAVPALPVPLAAPGKPQGTVGWLDPAGLAGRTIATPPPELTWALASFALAAGVGWVVERRRRRLLELERDSAMWPTERKAHYAITSPRNRDDVAANSSEVGEAGPSIQVLAITETTSRREATLVDLHQLLVNLKRLRGKRDTRAAADLLEAHLVGFRYTSPWVFLELRELYRELEQPREWELAREAFRLRFGQNAPQWGAPSTVGAEIADDAQLCRELLRKWPRRDARLFILRWMLGDATSRQKSFGPPQLALGIYREMMFLDGLLDEAMAAPMTPTPVAA